MKILLRILPANASGISHSGPRALRRCPRHQGSLVPGRAFSLVELLVTMTLLSFIVLGLLAMFNQTQRAFRGSMTQSDVLEDGRALTDMLARELEQMSPAQVPYVVNFQAETPLGFKPVYQSLPGSTDVRTNVIHRLFFLTRVNQDLTGTGYQVLMDGPESGVGTLCRFFMTNTPRLGPIRLDQTFLAAPVTNLNRLADGVVHFQVRAYDTNGVPITPYSRVRHTTALWSATVPNQVNYLFTSNALPAYVELELGILEQQALRRFKAIGAANAVAQRQYLSNHVAQVHIFRQRIPVRNLDITAYQ